MRSDQNDWPRSLDEAVDRLLSGMSHADKEAVRATPEDDLLKFHFGWARNLRHEFGLWHNADLLASCGDQHPEDASLVIVGAVWQRLQRDGLAADTPPPPSQPGGERR